MRGPNVTVIPVIKTTFLLVTQHRMKFDNDLILFLAKIYVTAEFRQMIFFMRKLVVQSLSIS